MSRESKKQLVEEVENFMDTGMTTSALAEVEQN